MAWKQLQEPDLDPYIRQPNGSGGSYILNDWLGWCLAYVSTAFNSGWAGATAWQGWERTALKHQDRSLPSGVYIPLWFSGYYGFGHVVIYKDGVIWSSPISHKPTADVWYSIEDIERNYGVTYVGWSEDIGGTLVAQYAPDPSPEPIRTEAYQRTVGPNGANYRKEPNTGAEFMPGYEDGLDVGATVNFRGWVHGENYNGNDIWFVGKFSNGYSWSGAFTDSSTHDLEDLNKVEVPVVPTPPVPVQQSEPIYTFEKDLPCVTEVIPTVTGNFEKGRFPEKPAKVVMHDFGTKNVDTVGSVINHFTGKNVEVSAHFVVSGKRIIQMVSLKDRAYHAGPNGNDFIGIELDPTQDTDTITSGKKVLKELRDKYGYKFELIEHNQIMPTACGDDINLADYEIDPPTLPDPVEPDVDYDRENNSLLKQILEILKKIFRL
jgi:hypothetical protein